MKEIIRIDYEPTDETSGQPELDLIAVTIGAHAYQIRRGDITRAAGGINETAVVLGVLALQHEPRSIFTADALAPSATFKASGETGAGPR